MKKECCSVLAAIALATFLYAPEALALTETLTAPQITEALEFGAANAGRIEAVLSDLYGCCGKQRDLVIRSKWCKLALLAGIKAQQGGAAAASDQAQIMQDSNLQIDIAVYGPVIDFARDYRARIEQDNATVKPELLHADHFQKGKNLPASGHDFSPWYAIIRAYFPYKSLKLDHPFRLVLETQREQRTYDIDPRKFK